MLVAVQAPDAKTNLRNLITGSLARLWTEILPSACNRGCRSWPGALAQDGGVAVDDLTAHMPDEEWAAITKEFFLS